MKSQPGATASSDSYLSDQAQKELDVHRNRKSEAIVHSSGDHQAQPTTLNPQTAVSAPNPHGPPMAVTIRETCHLLSLGKTTVYALLGDGSLNSVMIGGARRVLVSSIKELLDSKKAA